MKELKKLSLTLAVASVLGFGFSGCGGGGDDSAQINNNIPSVSNIGNNINGLGYYGTNVYFGDEKLIQESKTKAEFLSFEILENGLLRNNSDTGIYYTYNEDGSGELSFSTSPFSSAFELVWGVNENGSELSIVNNIKQTYLGKIDISTPSSNYSDCIKYKETNPVYTEPKYYAYCRTF